MGPFDRLTAAASRGDVVVLDEDGGAQVFAMIESASAADGVSLEGAEPGGGLSCVGDAGRRAHGECIDESPSHGRHPSQPLHEVESHALPEQDRRGGSRDPCHECAGRKLLPVVCVRIDVDQRVDLSVNLVEDG